MQVSALEEMQWIADPHADDAVAAILGPCGTDDEARARRVDQLNAVIRTWQTNAGVAEWRPNADMPTAMGDALLRYVEAAKTLPPWADRERLDRTEQMFMDFGALSVTILFCASLPETYVVPDLAAVLHATGQLEARTDHRIRTTGAMIFPVMMPGGLTRPDGSGIAQILKVRLIHAMVRNLILRGSPQDALESMRPIPALSPIRPDDSMSQALHVHGWNLEVCALPNNQEELAYTLLTFNYVFLRSMRRLGIPLTDQQERDYLHTWNVAGHYLGIRREVMADTGSEAAEGFALMQARGRAEVAKHAHAEDPRPALGNALMDSMAAVIPLTAFKCYPRLLTRRLIEPQSARDLGLDTQVSWFGKASFAAIMGTAYALDTAMRRVFPDFSITRLITRVIGYRLINSLLMSMTRELAVPDRLRPGIRAVIAHWGSDPKASSRMNAVEDWMTTRGDWRPLGSL